MTKYKESLTTINFSHVYRNMATIYKRFSKITATEMQTTTAQTTTNPFE